MPDQRKNDYCSTGWTPPRRASWPNPNTVTLCATVLLASRRNLPIFVQSEILEADGNTRTALVLPHGRGPAQRVPFSCLQSVALYEGGKVLQAFGRPPAAGLPAWMLFVLTGEQIETPAALDMEGE